jgi:uncharacterized protein (DUF1501 family)
MSLSRRGFLKACCGAALGTTMPGAFGFFDPGRFKAGVQHDVLVYLFLRGGIDGLHLVVPSGGGDRSHYEAKRTSMAIPVTRLRPAGASPWGFHPRLGGDAGTPIGEPVQWLHQLWNESRLAVVHATGLVPTVTRSHFDAQAYIELGTPGLRGSASGWMSRYLAAGTGLPTPIVAPALAFASNTPESLLGADEAISMSSGQEFRVDGFHWPWNDSNPEIAGHQGAHTRLFALWQGQGSLEQAGRRAAEAATYMREIDFRSPEGYIPEGGAQYPGGGDGQTLGVQLRNLAQLIKLDAGLVCATLDYGGWDTHEGQGMPNPGDPSHYDYFGNRLEGLSRALHAFYRDLAGSAMGDLSQRVTVIVQSEFGRRFRPNGSAGTDHGYGNVMLALGGRANGGQFHGVFPGLADDQLFEGQDVLTTTDYRQVIAEALVDRMGLPPSDLASVFPGMGSYMPRGVFQVG